ncbi:Retrovirus-related Pol polyprotein from transposon TNT 1-94 [Vitis vinifera]|uniref:Retrovirus-related Pol polyprotein from transposon TNT 1-94 n=1 Tax=Vitis vinifera TaxID=29760 RepID=A0A438K7H7_VITVI|nr:Retrovirus-related Pol polyprotein from transposon TNT 1-94 [Vitis vinifera]
MIGYGNEEFGYKLWDPEKQKIVRSRDIVFHEHETIKDMEKNVVSTKLTYEGNLDEEIFMEQLEGFKVKGKENMVCKLKKSMYGLK